jgi:hypothetical protein
MKDVLKRINPTQLIFWCEGCKTHHYVQHEGVPKWDWCGSLQRPTVRPSILCRGTVPITDEEHTILMNGGLVDPKPTVCHMMIRDGQIEYLGDCTHALAGRTVAMTPFEEV